MIAFAKRNLKLFFRDKATVFFSMLSLIVILGLYVLFLGNQLAKNYEDEVTGANCLMDSWIMAGILAVTPVSTTLGSFGIMVNDKAKKINKDFRSSPIKHRSLAGGYIISAFCIGTIMSVIALTIIEVYFAVKGYALLSALGILEMFGAILVSVFISSSMMYLIVSLFSSQNAFATANILVGTLIGFITGIYIPIGATDKAVQYVIEIFPVSHAASVFRKILMSEPMKDSFKGAPNGALTDFKLEMGVDFEIFGHTVTTFESIAYLIVLGLVFYALGIMISHKKAR